MLKQLYIKDFTLIDELNIQFFPGFSVITGETGAGKSIVIGALHLLLGQRADSKQVKLGRKKCIIEAHFDLSRYDMESFFDDNEIDYDATDCILRREVSEKGKSRAFINDTPVSLTTLRDLGDQLIDIHSQHQNLLLQKEDFQLNVVDIIAGDAPLLADYKGKYSAWLQAKKAYADYEEACCRNKENEEFLRFQFSELDRAKLVKGEEQDLEQRSQTMSHTEDIKNALFTASEALSKEDAGGMAMTRAAADSMGDITEVYPEAKAIADRLDSVYIDLKDISREIDSYLENVDFDPQELDAINERLDLIYSLEQKFHVSSSDELIAEQEKIKTELDSIDGGSERLSELKAESDKAYADCLAVAKKLSHVRRKAAAKVEDEMRQRLVPLGIPKVRFAIDFKEGDCTASGTDRVSFLFSANSSTALQPVAQVASGGEIARVMLSLKAMISGAVKLPTIIFDEIDTGVSGRVAEKMAQIMREMGDRNRQVISITHLPQIAAMGTTHYKVSKEETPGGTVSHMRLLAQAERVDEIAQMLSGSSVSQAAIDNARTLLENAR